MKWKELSAEQKVRICIIISPVIVALFGLKYLFGLTSSEIKVSNDLLVWIHIFALATFIVLSYRLVGKAYQSTLPPKEPETQVEQLARGANEYFSNVSLLAFFIGIIWLIYKYILD